MEVEIETSKVNCNNVSSKCDMSHLVNNMLESRKKGNFGQIGPCQFESVDDFLKKQKEETRVPTTIFVSEKQKVAAMGDIHGDLLALLGTLKLLSLIDRSGNWIGRNSIVIQCGDLLDREGRVKHSKKPLNTREEVDIIQYLHALNKVAESYGGGIVWCLGNHDLARVFWDERFLSYVGSQVEGWGGKEKMFELFKPGGKMARYMAQNSILIVKAGEFAFLHGGFTPETIKKIKQDLRISSSKNFFSEINRHIRWSLRGAIKPIKSVTKIAWERNLSHPEINSDEAQRICSTEMKQIFDETGMDWNRGAFVVGHSIQPTTVPVYCDGRVWRVDLGMSEAFKDFPDIPRVVGGIKIFQYQDKPFVVLTATNFSYEPDENDKFIIFINKGYKNIMKSPKDGTKVYTKWKRLEQDIFEIYKDELQFV